MEIDPEDLKKSRIKREDQYAQWKKYTHRLDAKTSKTNQNSNKRTQKTDEMINYLANQEVFKKSARG